MIDDDEPHPAALNMAIDEALLERLEQLPLLRCYRWISPAVSFGCFGNVAAVRRDYPAADCVRRWTGGGIVEHGRDFTYSLLVPRALPLATLPASECYRLIHGAVASGLSSMGFREVEASEPAAAPRTDAAPYLKPCFANPVAFDLLLSGRKIAGGAQRRTRRGLLHQGSIQGALLGEPAAGGRWQRWKESLRKAFADRTIRAPVATEAMGAARLLAARKYGAASWTDRF